MLHVDELQAVQGRALHDGEEEYRLTEQRGLMAQCNSACSGFPRQPFGGLDAEKDRRGRTCRSGRARVKFLDASESLKNRARYRCATGFQQAFPTIPRIDFVPVWKYRYQIFQC